MPTLFDRVSVLVEDIRAERSGDDYVPARSVVPDRQRLAFDGYKVVDSDTESILGLSLHLQDGQRRIQSWPNVFQAVRNRPGEIQKELARPLLQAVANYLNAGGDPDAMRDLVDFTMFPPKLSFPGFELAGVREESDREVYFITTDRRVIRVIPGVISEEVSQEELDSTNEEDCEEAAG